MKTILSLFDHSGHWSEPYRAAGHDVIQVDIKHDPRLHDIRKLNVRYLTETLGIEWVDGIIAAPPCTDFTKSGAWCWPDKDADGRTAASVHLVRQVLRCVEYFKPDFWVFENPVGRLPRLVQGLGKPFIFQPADFAGYMDSQLTKDELLLLADLQTRHARGLPCTKKEIELIRFSNRYTKQTCLWGRFNDPTKDPREPIRVCNQGSWLQLLGGKSDATKEARSVTPEGFSNAFFNANCWTEKQREQWAAERSAEWIHHMMDTPSKTTDQEILEMHDPDEHPETTAQASLEAYRRLYPKNEDRHLGLAQRVPQEQAKPQRQRRPKQEKPAAAMDPKQQEKAELRELDRLYGRLHLSPKSKARFEALRDKYEQPVLAAAYARQQEASAIPYSTEDYVVHDPRAIAV